MLSRVRGFLGVLARDLPRYVWALCCGGRWGRVRNRQERLDLAPDGSGYRCDWQWTSDLHAPKVLPFLGRWLMRRALHEQPIRCRPEPEHGSKKPDISFVVGHRGRARLPNLLATLRSIAGQRDVCLECIVVEQSAAPEIEAYLPAWVRYVHTPLPTADMPYCRAWAFNVGARLARGALLILHDNDLLIPQDYGRLHLGLLRQGWEVINLKRYIFYLSPQATQRACEASLAHALRDAPESILQNAEGGGSLAIGREAYLAIGGFDEAFIGWGGEDNELWDRALTRRLYPFGYLPLVHLWHPAQPGKRQPDRERGETAILLKERLEVPPEARIQELRQRNFGDLLGSGLPRGFRVP